MVKFDSEVATIGDLLRYARALFSVQDLAIRGSPSSSRISELDVSMKLSEAKLIRTILVVL